MCGVCGFTLEGKESPPRLLENMVACMEHRGPDSEGRYIDEQIALGHRRLAVIDTTEQGRQPFAYGENGRYVLVFNGEIYNYLELRRELEQEGLHFQTQTDTEVLAAAYSLWGPGCQKRFNGMWAFAIYDQVKRELFCSRDRFGVKPFYYCAGKGLNFAFASEIKPLLLLPGIKARANRQKLAAFLAFGELDAGQETLFEGILQLRGGHSLCVNLQTGEYRIEQWYNLLDIQENLQADFLQAARQFKDLFYEAVKLRERSDVPVGYCLSGGLDSSAIVCASAQMREEEGVAASQQCIHSRSSHAAYDESAFARLAAEQAGSRLHYVEADPARLFPALDKILWHMDEPFGSTSIYAQWCVFQKAGELGLTVMLDGQGADEQLAGYTPFVPVWLAEARRRGSRAGYRKALAAWRGFTSPSPGMVARMRLLACAYRLLPAAAASRMIPLYGLLGKPFGRALRKLAGKSLSPDRVDSGQSYVAGQMQHGMQALLHYEDRSSMAFSIESRVPFLDWRLVEAMFALPLGEKLKDGQSKAIMREALRGVLPEQIRTRRDKKGFVTPEVEWMKSSPALFRQELSEACARLAPLLDGKKVLRWFDAGKAFRAGDYTTWRIICAGRWMKVFQVELE